jgi:2-polyprenyl-3-methyl-5-hydroxy-6-metoxy-1,4-benzoquinol methylase
MSRKNSIVDGLLDPVAAYDRIAPQFPAIALRRKRYLDAIDSFVAAHVSVESRALLDIGAGDGSRARKIAAQAGIPKVILLEPSRGMIGPSDAAEIWRERAEDLVISQHSGRFDVILCLWNVLGHVPSTATRVLVLRKMRDLLMPCGKIFMDVNHRYNVRAYGVVKTALRYGNDIVLPRDENGDVTARWLVDGTECSTYGHVFTDREMRRLSREACLKIEDCIPVDYETGKRTRFLFQGNLLYGLKP